VSRQAIHANSGFRGAWRLAVRVPGQAVWKPVTPGDIGEAKVLCLFWMCVSTRL